MSDMRELIRIVNEAFDGTVRAADYVTGNTRDVEVWRNPTRADFRDILKENPDKVVRAIILKGTGDIIAWNGKFATHGAMANANFKDWNGICLLLEQKRVCWNDFNEYMWDETYAHLDGGIRPFVPNIVAQIEQNSCLAGLFGSFTVVGLNNLTGDDYPLSADFLSKNVTRKPRG